MGGLGELLGWRVVGSAWVEVGSNVYIGSVSGCLWAPTDCKGGHCTHISIFFIKSLIITLPNLARRGMGDSRLWLTRVDSPS